LESRIEEGKKINVIATVDIETDQAFCHICGKRMIVQKTVTRTIVTLRHKQFKAHERVLQCPSGCKYPNGETVIHRAPQLHALVPSGSNYGYDVEVFVGIERFINHRQREEIMEMLKEQHAITISTGEVSVLTKRFASHIEALHKSHTGSIRAVLSRDGGYPLHIDCTTEGGKGTLLVIFEGWRRWVLGAWKIPSERADFISQHITEISDAFGEPCAIMRDLGQPIARAVLNAVDKMNCSPKIFACHFHFLRDVGKGLLDDDYGHLRKLAGNLSVREDIRVAVRKTRKKIDQDDMDYLYTWFDSWIKTDKTPILPGGSFGISLVVALGLWILDYTNDGQNLGFPFDCPYHNLYLRCKTADKAIDEFLLELRFDRNVNKALERLKKAISPFLEDKAVRKTVRELEMRMTLFSKLRKIFQVEGKSPEALSPDVIKFSLNSPLSNERHATAFDQFEKDVHKQANDFAQQLRKHYESAKTGPDLKHSIKIILDHLDKHDQYLWGHLVKLHTERGYRFRLVDRTNNVLETFFHKMKHGERRRSGRKILTRDFENIPPSAALAMNLTDPEYVNEICGDLDNLPTCFSKIDRDRKEISLNTAIADRKINFLFNDDFLISSSDKSFVRKETLNDWILAASICTAINSVNTKVKVVKLEPFEDMQEFLQTVPI
jgi:hypothetical protein